jgi:hypothetical protein
MALFAGRKPGVNVFEQVRAMKAQGMPNDRIIQSLQKDGFNAAEIVDALNKSESSSPGYPIGGPDFSQPMPQQQFQQPFSPPQRQEQMPQQQQPISQPQGNYDVSSSEELIEAIIDEKWNDLVKDINKIIEWKNKTDQNIISLTQQFEDLKNNFDKVHQAIVGKIGEYDKNILEVGTEIKAMEKVFSKVLPVFTENVNELSRITENIKKKK